jgi:hypothetical protein
MTWDASARVNDLFAASARVCTPAPASHMATVLFTPVSRDPEAVSRFASVLSDAEKWRAQHFLTEDGEAHFKQRRAFRRYCGALAADSALPLLRIAFSETEKGRPYLPELRDCWFSFSSCAPNMRQLKIRLRAASTSTTRARRRSKGRHRFQYQRCC